MDPIAKQECLLTEEKSGMFLKVKNSLEKSEKNVNVESNGFSKESKQLKIPSALDVYCKTSALDESLEDFIECSFKSKKFRSETKKIEILCEICKQDITCLDVNDREKHVNSCIDNQNLPDPEVKVPTSENESVLILECPVCFKQLPSIELRLQHIKKCGKSKGLSLQSIVKALELQERHAIERISLGLPAKPVRPIKSNKNPVQKRAIVEPKSKAHSDIQLARALSLSLATPFTLVPPTAHHRPGKKCATSSTPLLVLRNEEERKRLLLDKVATILESVADCGVDSSVPMNTDVTSSAERKDLDEGSRLWSLSSKAADKAQYYVHELLDWMKPSEVEVRPKFSRLSQIAGHEIVTQLPCEYTFSVPEVDNASCPGFSSPSSSVIDCLRSLVASSWMSDVDIHTACGSVVPAHRLLLAARCPPLKQDSRFCSGSEKIVLKWDTVSFDAALQFLNYLYTGNIEMGEDISDLSYLAHKYEVSDLQALLSAHTNSTLPLPLKSSFPLDSGKPLEFQPMEVTQECLDLDIVEDCIQPSLPLTPKLTSQRVTRTVVTRESLGETNVDLDIVHDCIHSSLRPSLPTLSCPSPKSAADSDFVQDPEINCNAEENFSSSPVIFDVDDSDRENNSSSDEDLNCSQQYCDKKPNRDTELGGCASDSSHSENSVKFVMSTFSSFGSPGKERNDASLKAPVSLKKDFIPKVNTLPDLDSPVRNGSKEFHSGVNCEWNRNHRTSSTGKLTTLENAKVSSFNETVFHCERMRGTLEMDSTEILNSESRTAGTSVDNGHSCVRNHSRAPTEMSPAFKRGTGSSLEYNEWIDNSVELSVKEFCPDSSPEWERSFIRPPFRAPESAKSSPSNELKGMEKGTLQMAEILNYVIPLEEKESEMSLVVKRDAHSPPGYDACLVDALPLGSAASPPEILILDSDSSNSSLEIPSPYKDCRVNVQSNEVTHPTASPLDFKVGRSSPRTEGECPVEGFSTVDCERGRHSKRVEPVLQQPLSLCSEEKDLRVDPLKKEISPQVKGTSGPSVSFSDTFDPLDVCFEVDSPFREKSIHSPGKTAEDKTTSPHSQLEGIRPKFRLTDSPVTPVPDFKSMMTPEIKEALKKIGVKALPRRKALTLLSHIYDETHPVVNEGSSRLSVSQSSPQPICNEKRKRQKRKMLSENVTEKQQKVAHSRALSVESDDSSAENPDWLGCVPEMSFSQALEDSPTKINRDDLESAKQYILSNQDLYSHVLQYKPLNIKELHLELKNNGIKISIQKLMDFLDEQCITFTCPRNEEYRKKQTARTQRFRKNRIAKMSQQQPS